MRPRKKNVVKRKLQQELLNSEIERLGALPKVTPKVSILKDEQDKRYRVRLRADQSQTVTVETTRSLETGKVLARRELVSTTHAEDAVYYETNSTVAKKVKGQNKGSKKVKTQKEIEYAFENYQTDADSLRKRYLYKIYEAYETPIPYKAFVTEMKRKKFRKQVQEAIAKNTSQNVFSLITWDFVNHYK